MAISNLKPAQLERVNAGLLLSIIIPTLNEFENLKILLPQIATQINCIPAIRDSYEIIVVDDQTSPETMRLIEEFSTEYNIKILPSGTRRGLARSALEGFVQSRGAIALLMDGDGSHNPLYISNILDPILDGKANISIGSRYTKGGKVEKWPLKRHIISKICALLSHPLTGIKDSGSGFFAFKKDCVDFAKIKPKSWKIGMEIFTKFPNKVQETPIVFADRKFGESKFNFGTGYTFSKHLCGLYLFKIFGRKN